jgi:2-polyprenyl-3-methyl-5-hydroxy-6-metoxy-1,4-benzoquinol methylase
MSGSLEKEIARAYPRRGDRYYVLSKMRSDPLYAAVHEQIGSSELPLLDLGCGLGLLAFYLRLKGSTMPIHGLDYDGRKIRDAKVAAERLGVTGIDFAEHDARQGLPEHSGNVTILDILQFFSPSQQEALVQLAAERVAPGGKLVIRTGLHDETWRFKITVAGDILAKITQWMKAAPMHYPAAEDFRKWLSGYGRVDVRPLWGSTPFNNHLVVLERPAP